MSALLQRIVAPVLTPPFVQPVELDLRPLQSKSQFSILWRRLRPWLALRAARQTRLERAAIDPRTARLLWIYKGSPQVGDALMDLSSRVLLEQAGLQVDLYTDPHLATLFAADRIFSKVFSDPSHIAATHYDLVIVDSFKARCLKEKIRHLARAPFVTMRGYFSGPEFNRTLFSFLRMRQLLAQEQSLEEVSATALPSLFGSDADRAAIGQVPLQPGALAIAIGGADPSRTYRDWVRVIGAMLDAGVAGQLVLLGSDNARSMRDEIVAAHRASAHRIVDCVAAYSLRQTFEIMQRCRLAVCCDGGLLHVAHAAHLPTVALFDSQVRPAMRLTAANRSFPLCSPREVGAVPAADVAQAILNALNDAPHAPPTLRGT